MQGRSPRISVLILTRDEAVNLPACLKSVAWSDDIVVFDSMSDDNTTAIALAAGARVFTHAFENYGSQREAARLQVKYKHPWVLAIDADETPEPELVEEMSAVANSEATGHSAFRMRRKDYFMGKWIRHSTLYPSWFVRFYRPDKISYGSRAVHEYPDVAGSTGELRGHLTHHSFGKGLTDWLEKHNRYSLLEAREALRSIESKERIGLLSIFDIKNPVNRRKALKLLSYRMPFRPTLRFVYMYIIRLGFLDGRAGLTYCRLLAMYEYMIVLKMKEIGRREKGLPM